jgi:energy-coupling factor transporter ATP-binding protein EcfA2
MGISTADVVSEAHKLFTFIRTPAGEPYAIPNNGRLRRALSLDQIESDLAAVFYVTGDIPGPQTVASAMSVLSAQTRDKAAEREVYLRLARLDSTTYLDLGTKTGEYVEVSAAGWTVKSTDCPVLFTRTAISRALPMPSKNALTGRAELAELLALKPSDDRFRIAWGWLVAQVLPSTARPMIYFLGAQGSGKTTRGLMLANVLEPQSEMGAVLKKTERENNPVAKAAHILTADNMTKMSEDVSNWLCSLVTGHRVVERRLYTNSETISYSLKRTGIFTGKIKPVGLEADAEERMLFLEFERMAAAVQRPDDDVFADFHAAHPRILGALLDAMVAALALLPSIDNAATRGYRFGNFAKVFAALDRLDAPGYVEALVRESTGALAERVYESPDLVAVLRVVAADAGAWVGTATELADAIRRFAPADAGRPSGPWWPPTGAHLSTRLRNQQHALSLAGLGLEFRKSNAARCIHATMAPADVDRWTQPTTISEIADVLGGRR